MVVQNIWRQLPHIAIYKASRNITVTWRYSSSKNLLHILMHHPSIPALSLTYTLPTIPSQSSSVSPSRYQTATPTLTSSVGYPNTNLRSSPILLLTRADCTSTHSCSLRPNPPHQVTEPVFLEDISWAVGVMKTFEREGSACLRGL